MFGLSQEFANPQKATSRSKKRKCGKKGENSVELQSCDSAQQK